MQKTQDPDTLQHVNHSSTLLTPCNTCFYSILTRVRLFVTPPQNWNHAILQTLLFASAENIDSWCAR
jgi:hypothetical protein